MNENEMNFRYLDVLDVEFLYSNFESKETILSIDENSTEKYNNEQKAVETQTSSEGLTLKELANQLKYAFLEPEREKPIIISTTLTESEEHKLLETLRKIQGRNCLVYRRFKRNQSFHLHAQDPFRG